MRNGVRRRLFGDRRGPKVGKHRLCQKRSVNTNLRRRLNNNQSVLLLNNEGLEWDNLCEIGCSAVRHSQPEPPHPEYRFLCFLMCAANTSSQSRQIMYDMILCSHVHGAKTAVGALLKHLRSLLCDPLTCDLSLL